MAEVLADPHTAHRGMVVEEGSYKGVFTPIRLSDTRASVRHAPPDFGADTRAVLAEAGLSPEEIDALFAAGAAR